jgi:hypothetical protein
MDRTPAHWVLKGCDPAGCYHCERCAARVCWFPGALLGRATTSWTRTGRGGQGCLGVASRAGGALVALNLLGAIACRQGPVRQFADCKHPPARDVGGESKPAERNLWAADATPGGGFGVVSVVRRILTARLKSLADGLRGRAFAIGELAAGYHCECGAAPRVRAQGRATTPSTGREAAATARARRTTTSPAPVHFQM